MKYLKIQNAGNLDVRLIALMGGTTKAEDSFKIGHFGTGLKYTLAYLLRNDIVFHIAVDGKFINVTTREEEIADQTFDIIYIDGERTSITVQMGKDWEPWMIIRELYSNALDEGEASYDIHEGCPLQSGTTQFFIQATPEILEVYNSWDKYFLVGKEPFYENDRYKIYPHSGNLKLYKQGILIHESKSESLFCYDIKNAKINELREYTGHMESDICKIVFSIDDRKAIQYFMEHLKEDHYEASADYDYNWYQSFNDVWKEELEGVKIIHTKAKEDLLARGIEVDEARTVTVPEKLYKGLSKKFEGIGALRASKAINDFYEIYDETLHDRVRQAQKLLENAGYLMSPELTFCYGVFGDKTTLARIDLDQKKIYVSEKHLEKDLFSICTMLVEENEHFKTGFGDHTREFQQHFINLYVNGIIEESTLKIIDNED